MRVRIGIRSALLREAVRLLVGAHAEADIVEDAEESGWGMADVLIVAVGLPGEDGIDLIERGERDDAPNVLALGSGTYALLGALQAGARGCLPLDADPAELATALAAVSRGDAYIHPSVGQAVLAHYRRGDGREAPPVLTPREREVLVMLAEGYTNRAIADRLHLSVRTVETHRANIMMKLDADSLADLIFAAIRLGLIIP